MNVLSVMEEHDVDGDPDVEQTRILRIQDRIDTIDKEDGDR